MIGQTTIRQQACQPVGLLAKYFDQVQSFNDGPIVRKCIEQTEGLVLDIGCGVGRAFPYFLSQNRRVIGVDSSDDMLNQARIRFANNIPSSVELMQGVFDDVVLPQGLGLVTCLGATFPMIVGDLENMKMVLFKIYKALVSGGIFLVTMSKTNNHAMNESASVISTRDGDLNYTLKWATEGQHLHYTMHMIIGQCAETYYFRKLIFSDEEFLNSAESVGFKLETSYGDFDQGPISPSSKWSIFSLIKP